MKNGGIRHLLTLTLRPRAITRCLAMAVAVMALASVVAQWVRHVTASEDVRAVARIFKLSAEDTIPAFFSAVTLLVSAGLFWAIGRCAAARGEVFVRHWRGLAVIFTYMS